MKFLYKKRQTYYYKRKMIWNHWLVAFRNVSFLLFPLWDWTRGTSTDSLVNRIVHGAKSDLVYMIISKTDNDSLSDTYIYSFSLLAMTLAWFTSHAQLWLIQILLSELLNWFCIYQNWWNILDPYQSLKLRSWKSTTY